LSGTRDIWVSLKSAEGSDGRPCASAPMYVGRSANLPNAFALRERRIAPTYTSAACLSVITTGLVSTSRKPHHPAASASTAPVAAPASGTHGEGFQVNSNT